MQSRSVQPQFTYGRLLAATLVSVMLLGTFGAAGFLGGRLWAPSNTPPPIATTTSAVPLEIQPATALLTDSATLRIAYANVLARSPDASGKPTADEFVTAFHSAETAHQRDVTLPAPPAPLSAAEAFAATSSLILP